MAESSFKKLVPVHASHLVPEHAANILQVLGFISRFCGFGRAVWDLHPRIPCLRHVQVQDEKREQAQGF